jgi:hypothetical protein
MHSSNESNDNASFKQFLFAIITASNRDIVDSTRRCFPETVG